MRTKTFILLSGLLAFGIASAFADSQPTASPAQKFTCIMHPEVVQDRPGHCPKCGMTLVPKKEDPKKETDHLIDHEAHRLSATHAPKCTMAMQSSVDLADPMSRESSGTAWVPDSTPMYGKMFMLGDDMLMLHGGAFPRYTNASTRRGDDRIDAPNWAMAMFSHSLGENAQLGFRGMMSLDPLTEGGRGYPLLFQSGESWQGEALHDRQHPHDLFDELSVTYSQKFEHDLSGLSLLWLSRRTGARSADLYASTQRDG